MWSDLKGRRWLRVNHQGCLCSKCFARKILGWQVVGRTASRFDENDVGLVPGGECFTSHQVRADVFPDGRVGTASRFDSENPGGWKPNERTYNRRCASVGNGVVRKSRVGASK